MSLASKPASRWAVSARTNGEVLTAGIIRSELELVVLGIPGGFSQPEIEGWLHDLAGVAAETSRGDVRTRALPALMHHALTGLLYSHSELWDRIDAPRPCSCAFVDLPGGAAFGWYGEARVHVLVDGDPVEPRWVRVRDEAGREANATVFAPGSDVVVTLQYWPQGDDGGVAPASLEAEWVAASGEAHASASWPAAPAAAQRAPAADADPTLIEPKNVPGTGGPEPPIEAPIAHELYPELPETLPQQQPSLATPASDLPRDPNEPGSLTTLIVPLGEEPVPLDPIEAPGIELRTTPPGPTRSFFDEMDQFAPDPAARAQFATDPVVSDPFALDASVRRQAEPEPEPFLSGRIAPAPYVAEPPAPKPAAAHAPARRPAVAATPMSNAADLMPASSRPAAPPRPEAYAADPGPIAPAAAKPAHPVARWLARVMNWGRPSENEPAPFATAPEPESESESESAPVSAYDSLLSDSVSPTSPEQAPLESHAGASAAAAHAPIPARPAVATSAPGTLRPAGLAEIFGAAPAAPLPASAPPSAGTPVSMASPVAPASPPSPPSPPATSAPASSSGSFAINQRLQDLLREIEAADAGHMPVLSPDLPVESGASQLEIDHEPVGADESFGIPRLPSALSVGPPVEDRITSIPPLPAARVVVSSPSPADDLTPPPPPGSFVTPPGALDVTPPLASFVTPLGAPEAEPLVPEVVVAPAFAPAVPSAIAPALQPVAEPPTVQATPESPPMLRVSVPSRVPAVEEAGPSFEPPAGDLPPAPPAPDDLAPVTPRVSRRPRSLDAPESFEAPKPPLHRRPVVWAVGVVTVFVVGWLVGGFSGTGAERGGPIGAALRAIGIGGAHFTANINSSPGGAQIEIDGKPQATRTPASLQLPPGEHVVKLLMPGLGAVEVPVKGRNGEKLTVDESLHGSLEILDTDSSVPISVSIDGRPAGYAPLKVESLAPGLHEVGFSGPGMPAWAQTVQVDIRGSAQLVARPMIAPASGVIQAQATLNDERGASPLAGAQVYVDGELRGVTPMTVELPRGPHSLRVTYRGETAPVQVIDLPGGNQRFASFNFGLDLVSASVTLLGSTRTFAAGEPKVVSASVQGLSANDVSEAWLHVRTAEGLWRRYAMTLLRGPENLVVTAVFPESVFDAQGNTRWYVRVITRQGDETFSEIQRSSLTAAAKPAARPQP